MKIHNAAKYFDKDLLTDGYSGATLYKGQFASFDNSTPDGTFSRKRTLSLAPGLTAPTRHVVSSGGERWIIGEPNLDQFQGRDIRQTFRCKKVNDSFNVRTPGQAALNTTASTTLYGFTEYLKDTTNTQTDASYSPQFRVTVGINEIVLPGQFLKATDKLLHVRSIYEAAEGFWEATTDEIALLQGSTWHSGTAALTNCEVAVSFPTSGAYNPISDTYTTSVSNTTGILLDRIKLYDLKSSADPANDPGDMTLVVAQSAVTPVSGQTLTANSLTWRIVSSVAYQDAWELHIRRA